MNSQIQYFIEKHFDQYCNSNSPNKSMKSYYHKHYDKYHYYKGSTNQNNSKNIYSKSIINSNDICSLDTDHSSHISTNINPKNENQSIIDNENIVIKKKNKFMNAIFNAFADNNSLCNFSIFEKSVKFNFKPDVDTINKMTLNEYFECFDDPSFMCLNVPFIEKSGKIYYNIFNPTLSSFNLKISSKKIKLNKINKHLITNNFGLSFIDKDYIHVGFDESNPPYNRDLIGDKINIIHKIIGVKSIFLSDVDINNSYYSILWTPADTHKFKSSFLSFYSFDFRLLGTLIIKMEEKYWFTTFCEDKNVYKDFKNEYFNKVNEVKNFIKKCHNIIDADNLDNQLFSHDYRRFLYNF